MPVFRSNFIPYHSNKEPILQCSPFGKLTVMLITEKDNNQNLSFNIIVENNNKIVFQSSNLQKYFEVPKLSVGKYKLKVIPNRDTSYNFYKFLNLKGFDYDFYIQAEHTNSIIVNITRKDSILYNIPYRFFVSDNGNKTDSKPLIEISSFEEVNQNLSYIHNSATKFGMDENLLKAVIYMESTHGYYDEPLNWVNRNKSIRPSNINVEFWKDLITREDASNKILNIEIGAYMLALITRRITNRGVREIASVYNDLNTPIVTDYGMRVNRIYVDKLWLKK